MALRHKFTALLFAVVGVFATAAAHAAVPSDTLMSAATKGYASSDDFDALCGDWDKTQYGHMMRDSAMQPFIEDFKQQVERKLTGTRQKLAISLKDLRAIAAGEMGLGLVAQERGRAVLALAADVTGRDEEVKALLARVDEDLTKRGGKRSTFASGGVQVTVYNVPPQSAKDFAREAVYFIHQDMLCATDSRVEAEEMIRRFNQGAGNRLADVPAYQRTMKAVADEAGDLKPQARWFIEPFGYAHAMRTLVKQDDRRTKDYVAIFESQGFDAIQGVGGFVNLNVGGSFELVHRTSIFAPPLKNSPEKYKLAMRMLEFPNGGDLSPAPWAPRDLASYRTFNADLQNAFKHFESLFNALAGYDTAYEEMLEGFEKDPYGPQVKIGEEFIQHLGQRVSLATDYDVPITTKSERFVVMIDCKNEKAVAAAIDKLMKADPNAQERQFEGKKVWEVLPVESDIPELDIAIDPLASVDEGEKQNTALSTSAVCVTNGRLFMASHMNYLKKVLSTPESGQSLRDADDFRQVQASLDELAPGEGAARFFVRTDKAYQPTYELLRQNKMPESETLLGRILNRMLTTPEDEDEGVLRKQRIDGRKLPNFEVVRQYFSPMGAAVRSTDDGWFVVGATLTRQTPQARAGGLAPEGRVR